jgi:hypothetical protein
MYQKVPIYVLYIHTYHSRFIPVGVAEASQIFLRVPGVVSWTK